MVLLAVVTGLYAYHWLIPILTAVITIAVMWGTYLLVLIFRSVQVFAKRRKKAQEKGLPDWQRAAG